MSSKRTRLLAVAALSAALCCLPGQIAALENAAPEKADADFALQGEYSIHLG